MLTGQIGIANWTPLHHAIESGHIDLVRILISEFHVNVNCVDSCGQTPLHYACVKGHRDMGRMLISDFQAVIECQDNSGKTPLELACEEGMTDVVRMLMSEFGFSIDFTLLHYACFNLAHRCC